METRTRAFMLQRIECHQDYKKKVYEPMDCKKKKKIATWTDNSVGNETKRNQQRIKTSVENK